MTLPDFTTPDALAEHLGISPRRVRALARGLGACRVVGKRMILLRTDVATIMAAQEPATARAIKDDIFKTPEKRAAGDKGVIYFVRCGGWIKIGWSSDIKGRLRTIQTSAPAQIDLIGRMPGTIKDERALHRRFSSFRTSGEWFKAAPEIVAYIETVKAKP